MLVGTVSVEKSEVLSEMLQRRGVKHEVLNAKFHEKEAPIVAQAGRLGAVTIATNMAGRGTDIKLGGDAQGLASAALHQQGLNPAEVEPDVYDAALAKAKAETAAEHDQVVAAGGLHIIGTERHDARRIDNQLRGRAGRQGDPGSSRFYLSLEDTLMKRFASDRVTSLMERMGLEGDVAIESRLVSKTIENAQSRVEGYNFDIRKRVVEYDDVINKQRETIYSERDKVLHNEDLGYAIMGFVSGELDLLAEQHLGPVMEEWDIDAFAHAVAHLGIEAEGIDADSLAELTTQDQIIDQVTEAAEATLAERQSRYGEQTWAMVERLVLLRIHRPAVGGSPHRAGRFPARGGPAWLRRHRSAGGVQARGIQALRRAAHVHPPPGRHDHLPGQCPGAAAGVRAAATATQPADAHAPADGDAPGRRRGTRLSGPARGHDRCGRTGRAVGLQQWRHTDAIR